MEGNPGPICPVRLLRSAQVITYVLTAVRRSNSTEVSNSGELAGGVKADPSRTDSSTYSPRALMRLVTPRATLKA